MTQNIEERTLAATATMEGAAKAVDEIAHKDADVITPVGTRKSFPKISREWDEKATELKTTWENDSATLRQDWQNERNELSTKALGVKPWESGVSETNINQQRRWDDGHTYLPKTVPSVMDAGGPNDDWIPYTADKSDTLNDVFGRKPVDLIPGAVLVPGIDFNYPKLNAVGKMWEIDDGDLQLVVKSFSESADNHLVITLDDDSMIIAHKMEGASRTWVHSRVGDAETRLIWGGIYPQNGNVSVGKSIPQGMKALRIEDVLWYTWDGIGGAYPDGDVLSWSENTSTNENYKTLTLETTQGSYTLVSSLVHFQRTHSHAQGWGAALDGQHNDTEQINAAVRLFENSGKTLNIIGDLLSDTIEVNNPILLDTNVNIQTVNDVDVFDIKAKVIHEGIINIRGVNREGAARGMSVSTAQKSYFDSVYIKNVALALDIPNGGLNNFISFKRFECEAVSWWWEESFNKGVLSSTVYNSGEITTASPIDKNGTGVCVIGEKSFVITPKPNAENTYFIAPFSEVPASGVVRHFSGGGVIVRDSQDNSGLSIDQMYIFTCRGVSYKNSAFYGAKISKGQIEGCQTNLIVSRLYIDTDGIAKTKQSISHSYMGLHTEKNTANEALAYVLKQSQLEFGGLIREGVRTYLDASITSMTGVKYSTNVQKGDDDYGYYEPIDPNYVMFRNVTTPYITTIRLRDLEVPLKSINVQARITPTAKMEINLLNIPAGQTRDVVFEPLGFNTVNGGTEPVTVTLTGVEGKTIYSVIAILIGKDFEVYIP